MTVMQSGQPVSRPLSSGPEEIVDWITGMIEYMRENNLTRAKPRKTAVD
ncbi:MAG: hypothetical protein ACKVG6_03350 [Alphaproteobacteria bacterium]|jgi:hypothetical protein